MNGLSLYQLKERVMELVVEIESAEIHQDTELIGELMDELEDATAAIDKKREAYIHVIRSAEAQANAIKEEVRRFTARMTNLQNLAKRLKTALHEDLLETGEVNAEAGIFRLQVYNSPPSVVFQVPPEMLPAKYRKVKVLPDTAAINLDLRKGIEVEGAKLHQGTHLRIK